MVGGTNEKAGPISLGSPSYGSHTIPQWLFLVPLKGAR